MLSLLNRHPLQILQRELQAQQRMPEPQNREISWLPHCRYSRDTRPFILFADIPGVGPEDLQIEVEDDVLTLNGKRAALGERRQRPNDAVSAFRENFHGRFACPSGSQRMESRLQVKNGVLRLTLPKAAVFLLSRLQSIFINVRLCGFRCGILALLLGAAIFAPIMSRMISKRHPR